MSENLVLAEATLVHVDSSLLKSWSLGVGCSHDLGGGGVKFHIGIYYREKSLKISKTETSKGAQCLTQENVDEIWKCL